MLAEEAPIAFSFNGTAFAVMMASPIDLEDFAVGFALAEGIVADTSAIAAIDIAPDGAGHAVSMTIPAREARLLAAGQRAVAGTAGCGLCGTRTMDTAMRALPYRAGGPTIALPVLHGAVARLSDFQTLNRATGAVHAAAFVAIDGALGPVREDVGRHNALDKVIGSLARDGRDAANGVIITTSRCSVELVQKAVTANVRALATISAPTTLATDLARQAGLSLAALVRPDGLLICADPEGRFAPA